MTSDGPTATRLSLLLRVRDLNDSEAWQDFLDSYAPRIFAWCRRFGLQDSDAADATQTVLTKLLDGLRSFDYDAHRGQFRAWLKTVTRNVATDQLRQWRERGTGRSSVFSVEPPVFDDPAGRLDQELELAYQDELLRRASTVVRLKVKPKTWDAWQLTADSVPATDVARQLGIPIGDVYVAKSRVMKMLREEVQRLESEDDRSLT